MFDFGWLPHLAIVYEIVEWTIRIAMLIVVPMRRTPEATRSWLLAIFFLPIPGLLLFLLIGRPRFPAWRAVRFATLAPMFADLSGRLRAASATSAKQSGAISALAETLGKLPAVGGNAFDLFDDYDAGIDRIVADIDDAAHTVRLLIYIFADDATGMRVIDALARAVARGVACHVMLDPVGSHAWVRNTCTKLRRAGVEVREALPFHLVRARTRRDMRNHRKIFVIDGRIGYVGSQNLVARDFRPGIVNRDILVRAEGPVVAEMTAVIQADWYCETQTLLDESIAIPPPAGDAVLQLLPSGADYPLEGFETLLTWQAHAATERITIVTPYLIPDDDLIGALRTARARGVEVDLIVSAVADQQIVSLAQCSYYDAILREGIHLYRYRDRLLHAKSVSIDRRLGIVGSSNVDLRSFQLNEEVSLLLLDETSIARLEACQRRYIVDSDRLDLATWRKRSWPRKLAENMARLIGPLL